MCSYFQQEIGSREALARDDILTLEVEKEISFKQAGSKDGGALPFIQLSGGLAASSAWYNNSVPTCLGTVLRIPVVPLASVLGPAATA